MSRYVTLWPHQFACQFLINMFRIASALRRTFVHQSSAPSSFRRALHSLPIARPAARGSLTLALLAGSVWGASALFAAPTEAQKMAAQLEGGAAMPAERTADELGLLEFTRLNKTSGGRVGDQGIALLHKAIDEPKRFQQACSIVSSNIAQVLNESPSALSQFAKENKEFADALAYLGVKPEREQVRYLLGAVWIAGSMIESLPEAVVMVAEGTDRTDISKWTASVIQQLSEDVVTAFLEQVPDDDRIEYIAAFGVKGVDVSKPTRALLVSAVAKVCQHIVDQPDEPAAK
jgi:hypothetical protein